MQKIVRVEVKGELKEINSNLWEGYRVVSMVSIYDSTGHCIAFDYLLEKTEKQ